MTLTPEPAGVKGYEEFIKRYQIGLPVESLAGQDIDERNAEKGRN